MQRWARRVRIGTEQVLGKSAIRDLACYSSIVRERGPWSGSIGEDEGSFEALFEDDREFHDFCGTRRDRDGH